MSDVIPFDRGGGDDDEDLILVCDCGGQTFFIHQGWFCCSACDEVLTDDLQLSRKLVGAEVVDREAGTRNRTIFPSEEMAQRRVLASVGADTAAIVVMNKDGITHVWSMGADSEEQREWFRKRVDDLLDQLI
jgi:hypothetical protein